MQIAQLDEADRHEVTSKTHRLTLVMQHDRQPGEIRKLVNAFRNQQVLPVARHVQIQNHQRGEQPRTHKVDVRSVANHQLDGGVVGQLEAVQIGPGSFHRLQMRCTEREFFVVFHLRLGVVDVQHHQVSKERESRVVRPLDVKQS
uniref:(northern house mosquito) hypothetical protein n=1 Tax=Culex pipiens TaxID=7175 RepID=A0A8D8GJG5_CULPI